MENISKLRMNLVAIKKVDPYARDIVTSSSHVAFYTFNSDKNEWEKTDVEGAFFIYGRNAQPYHSIFINNRLNTNSFVEPITPQLELQSQPPFLLYRNERSRIRGFWFYNGDECDRVSNLVISLVQESNGSIKNSLTIGSKQENLNLLKMLADAQKEFNNSQTMNKNFFADAPSNNVLEFFAAAKPAIADNNFKQSLPNTLSLEQIENHQRSRTNYMGKSSPQQLCNKVLPTTRKRIVIENSETNGLTNLLHSINLAAKQETYDLNLSTLNVPEVSSQKFLSIEPVVNSAYVTHEDIKPALMPPTMFEKPTGGLPISGILALRGGPLTSSQLVQTLSYLMQNDEEFVQKLHEAYLQVYAKTVVDTYQ